ncbi:YqaE/Pmp3 family membrane protein [Pontibacter rugosus]|uniref:YqaE/Pmp3 family membrane protein n=1 Tax=Pontibacter rugosus TaxID=1745966 RepID=A0ABW3SWV6_9BACT
MKIKNLLHFVMVLFVGQFLFSCSSAEYYKFSADKPEAYNTVKAKPATDAPAVELLTPIAAEMAQAETNTAPASTEAAPVFEANAAARVNSNKKSAEVVKTPAVAEEVKLEKREMTVAEAEAVALAKERLKNMSKAEKKELKRELNEVMRQRGGGANIVEIILAILLPPLAVFLHDGIGTSFWINIILTLLFVLPGIIHALLVVTDTI